MVRRDYAVQFAGTALGIVWLLLRYAFQIGLFFFVFGRLLPERAAAASGGVEYLPYLLGGMLLWLPVSEMMLRAASILTDNRSLIRRTSVGAEAFLWIAPVQAVLHYTLMFVLISAGLLFLGRLSLWFPIAYLFGVSVILFLSGWGFLFARVSVILKDVSPILAILLQVVFWSAPILYVPPPSLRYMFEWHPLTAMMHVHRTLLTEGLSGMQRGGAGALIQGWPGLAIFVCVSIFIFLLSSRRMRDLAGDEL
ncbi:MAG: ABC transporter permease [Spirochaetia bacterium]|nr:ABC transporter permease [Spirochaetia bacterium]